jgi:enterochelin esterase-like enzyme
MSRFRTVEISEPPADFEGLRFVTVHSAALRGRGDITVWSPGPPPDRSALPLVVLLHGVYGSHWAWALKGAAHRTAARLIASGSIPPMVLAMPSDGLSGDGTAYLDTPQADYESWILDDVPAAAAEVESRVDPAAPFLLAGLSMGGFGTLRLGGRHPERFLGLSAHSAVVSLDDLSPFLGSAPQWPVGVEDPDAAVLLSGRSDGLPPLRFDCGLEDPLLEANRALHQRLEKAGVPHRYEEFEGGHTWPYWERHLADTLRFFGGILAARRTEGRCGH